MLRPGSWPRLFCWVILANLIAILTPGYFNHEELLLIERAERLGLWDAIRGTFPSYHAGLFYRPLGYDFLQWSLWQAGDWPQLAHLIHVLVHAGVALLLARGTQRLTGSAAGGWLAGIVFAALPTGSYAVSWVTAVYDRFFALFGLAALYCFLRAGRNAADTAGGRWALLWTSLALLSKETALVLPVAALVLAPLVPTQQGRPYRDRRQAIAWMALPVLAYVALRAASMIVHALAESGASPYVLGLNENLGRNALHYFAFPFVASAPTIGVFKSFPTDSLFLAAALHLALILAAWRVLGRPAALAYGLFQGTVMLPALFLAKAQTHYLYLPGAALAVLLAFLWLKGKRRLRIALAVVVASMFAHHLLIQSWMYLDGRCQSELRQTLPELAGQKSAVLELLPEAGSRHWMLRQSLQGWPPDGSKELRFLEVGGSPSGSAGLLRFDRNCRLSAAAAPAAVGRR